MTAKQQIFVREYLVDLNATQAAIRAGYSPRTAKQIAHENLTKPDVAAAISAAQRDRMSKLEISADRVLQEAARIAFFDIQECFDGNGRLLPVHKLSDDSAAALASLRVVKRCSRCEEAERTAAAAIALLAAQRRAVWKMLHDAGVTAAKLGIEVH
jgi:phage terminase small subunit